MTLVVVLKENSTEKKKNVVVLPWVATKILEVFLAEYLVLRCMWNIYFSGVQAFNNCLFVCLFVVCSGERTVCVLDEWTENELKLDEFMKVIVSWQKPRRRFTVQQGPTSQCCSGFSLSIWNSQKNNLQTTSSHALPVFWWFEHPGVPLVPTSAVYCRASCSGSPLSFISSSAAIRNLALTQVLKHCTIIYKETLTKKNNNNLKEIHISDSFTL